MLNLVFSLIILLARRYHLINAKNLYVSIPDFKFVWVHVVMLISCGIPIYVYKVKLCENTADMLKCNKNFEMQQELWDCLLGLWL